MVIFKLKLKQINGDNMKYEFFYNSDRIKEFNFNTIFYIDKNAWLNMDDIVNDAINIEIAKINAKYGVDIQYNWDFLDELQYETIDQL